MTRSEATEGDPPPARRPWTLYDTVALGSLSAFAALLRIIRLGSPSKLMFDEVYYAKDACWYVEGSKALCKVTDEQTKVHPPFGKWLISAGIRIFGYDAVGWRIMAAVAGAICVALLFLLARKLLGSTSAATLAAALLALDPLHYVHSRIAMLDIFVACFTLAAFTFVVFDRDQLLHRAGAEASARVNRLRPWRLAAGVAAGLATASKWSGLFAVAGVIALSVVWGIAARAGNGRRRAVWRFLREEGPTIAAWLVVVPLVAYMLTYAGRLDGSVWALPWADGSWWSEWWNRQSYMYDTSRGLSASHPYQSPPWSWPLLKRAVSYYFDTPNGEYAEILGTGNPFIWWTSMLALGYVGWSWIRRHAVSAPEGFILAALAWTYVPWLALAGDRSAVFLFYFLPALPFLFLAPAYIAARIGESWEARTAIALFAGAAVGTFGFYLPVLANIPVPEDQWKARLWPFAQPSQCNKPQGRQSPTDDRAAEPAAEETAETSDDADDLPPPGWCWI